MSQGRRFALAVVLGSLLVTVGQPAAAQEGRYCIEWNGQPIYCIDY